FADLLRRPPGCTLFPYTTLFRSAVGAAAGAAAAGGAELVLVQHGRRSAGLRGGVPRAVRRRHTPLREDRTALAEGHPRPCDRASAAGRSGRRVAPGAQRRRARSIMNATGSAMFSAVISISGWSFAQTRKTSSAKPWPTASTPAKSRMTWRKRSRLFKSRFASERETKRTP